MEIFRTTRRNNYAMVNGQRKVLAASATVQAHTSLSPPRRRQITDEERRRNQERRQAIVLRKREAEAALIEAEAALIEAQNASIRDEVRRQVAAAVAVFREELMQAPQPCAECDQDFQFIIAMPRAPIGDIIIDERRNMQCKY